MDAHSEVGVPVGGVTEIDEALEKHVDEVSRARTVQLNLSLCGLIVRHCLKHDDNKTRAS